MAKQISGERKTAYYFGNGLTIVGLLLFLSTFVSFFMHFGDFSNFESDAKSGMLRAFGGVVLVIAGNFIRRIAARGVAGSGLVLDPEKAREDLEPYSRMAGGMVKDALDSADVKASGQRERVVMLKCSACGKLNEEDSKFCQQCGKAI